MTRKQLVGLVALGVALGLAVPSLLPAQSQEQQQTQEQEKPKKARKVWTNEEVQSLEGRGLSVVGTAAAPPQQTKKTEKPSATEAPDLWDELDKARADRDRWRDSMPVLRQGLEDLRERRRNADNDYDREMYDEGIASAEAEIASAEETVKELEARVAELEQLTKGKKRPPAEPAAPPPPPAETPPPQAPPPSPPPSL
jgi:hypothetical protein